tara:strand:- start:54965 stop:55165 length:201 start_codon:yes stop_codon:yes gene_type:complete
MDIICINNHLQEKYLTIDKIYHDVTKYGQYYIIVDDYNHTGQFYTADRFTTVQQYRDEKINGILNN